MSRSRPELVRFGVITLGRALCVVVVAVAAWLTAGALGVDAGTSSWIWLAATVLVAGTATLTRSPLERLADRIAYGPGGDPYAVLSGFVERVSETLAVDDVLPHVARTVTQALHSPRGEVRLWLADGEQWKQTWPVQSAGAGPVEPDELGMVEVPLQHHGEQVGELGVAVSEQLSTDDRTLLSRLAGTAGLALSNVRLAYDLRRQVAESTELADGLVRSRQRLLDAAAQQTERFATMVEHQVQSRLDAVGVALDRIEEGAVDAAAVAHTEATAALAALRELAAGVFPPALVDRGLRDALEMYCGRFDGRVRLRTSGDPARSPLAVESAAYFCVVQLVDDCVAAGPVDISVAHDADALRLEVAVSGPPPVGTVQLLTDRAEATSGRLRPLAAERQWSVDISWNETATDGVPKSDPIPTSLEIRT